MKATCDVSAIAAKSASKNHRRVHNAEVSELIKPRPTLPDCFGQNIRAVSIQSKASRISCEAFLQAFFDSIPQNIRRSSEQQLATEIDEDSLTSEIKVSTVDPAPDMLILSNRFFTFL